MSEELYKGLALGGPNAGKHLSNSKEIITAVAAGPVDLSFDPNKYTDNKYTPQPTYSHSNYYHKIIYIEGQETEFFVDSKIENVFDHLLSFYQQWAPRIAQESKIIATVDNIKILLPLLEQNITKDEMENLLFHLKLLRLNKGT